MKAVIKSAEFKKEFESKFGTMYQFLVTYDEKKAVYSSKNKEQKNFVPGQEAEFTEETKTYVNKRGENSTYLVIKPVNNFQKQSNFGKALKKEQSRYSGFATAYSKDLVVAGKLPLEELADYAWILFDLMVAMDKSLEQ